MNNLNLIEKAFLLKKTALFASLDLDLLLTISDKLEQVNYKKNEKIFPLNQEVSWMYLTVTGVVLIQDGLGDKLAKLAEGDFFGEESIFNDQPRAYEAISETDVTLLALSRSHLFSIITECPSVAIALLHAFSINISFRKR